MTIGQWHIINLDTVSSTNDIALKLSANPPAKQYVVTAQKQTAGRGRRGRVWQSPVGNLYMSQAFVWDEARLNEAVFVVSLSLLEAFASFSLQGKLQIKWPNDILLENHKISGILLEKGENGYIIVGIGVNVKNVPTMSEPMLYSASSLTAYGAGATADQVLQAYLQAFAKNLVLWREQGFEPIRDNWLSHLHGLHKTIEINLANRQESGILEGISDQGGLLLRQPDGVKTFFAGDIFYKEEANN